jgi:hypothetical protein
MVSAVAYVKYNATGITAIICSACATPEEVASVGDEPEGAEEITEPGVVICDRCGKVANG